MRKEIIVGISTAIGTTFVLYLAGKITQFPTVLVPSKAVVAFHAASCPDGWKEVAFTKGRVIVGVGEGKGLTSRHLLENGGEEQHKLTIEEMPRHKHVWRGVSNKKHDEYGFEGSEQNVYKEPGSSIDNIGEAAGEGKPHNNMPPFVALLYCEKQ
jgi:microcystin-dependent protein